MKMTKGQLALSILKKSLYVTFWVIGKAFELGAPPKKDSSNNAYLYADKNSADGLCLAGKINALQCEEIKSRG